MTLFYRRFFPKALVFVAFEMYEKREKGGDSVIKKRQIVALVSIVVVSFLIGTSLAATGGNPFDMIWEAIEDLQDQIDEIELIPGPPGPQGEQEPVGPQGPQDEQGPQGPPGFGEPDFDSGWRTIEPGAVDFLEHGLGDAELFVCMVGRYVSLTEPTTTYDIHQRNLNAIVDDKGAQWTLSEMVPEDTIIVRRGSSDTTWEQYRVYIWIIP